MKCKEGHEAHYEDCNKRFISKFHRKKRLHSISNLSDVVIHWIVGRVVVDIDGDGLSDAAGDREYSVLEQSTHI